MKTVLAITLVFAIGFQYAYASCHWKEIDLCIAGMLLFSQGSGLVPDTEEAVQQFCAYVQEAYQCVGNFSQKCMTKQMRDLALLFVEGTVESTNEFCTSGSEIQSKWLRHAPCLAENFEKGRKCFDDILIALDSISTVKPKERVPLFCCTFSRVRKCLINEVNNYCEKEAGELIDIIIRSFATDLPFIMSKPFDPDSEKCKSVLPPEGTKPKEGDEQSPIARLFSAFLGS